MDDNANNAAAAPLLSSEAVPAGFRFSSTRAGIKASGRADLACAVGDPGTTAAVMFTANQVVAAPVTLGRAHLRRTGGRMRGILVNSGNANCATGPAGMRVAEESCRAAADAFGCAPHEVLPSSTGIIGVPLPVEKLTAALPALTHGLAASAEAFSGFARTILTTDTRPKVSTATAQIDGRTVRLAGACKGAGMIHPVLQTAPHATMLAYLFTDAAAEPDELAALLAPAADHSFNRISIDGDTSTNDTLALFASGASGVRVTRNSTAFAQALRQLCEELALAIVEDGEGVTHVVTLDITGAHTDADALIVAKAIAHSPLVKTAWAGSDPNWGRLVSSIGASRAVIDPERITIHLNELPVCEQGGRAAAFDEDAVHHAMQQRRFTLHIDLGVGAGVCRFWTTDLTTEYVHINADYST